MWQGVLFFFALWPSSGGGTVGRLSSEHSRLEMDGQLGKPEVAGQRSESGRARAGERGIGEGGEVAGRQLSVPQCDVAALCQESAQPAHGRALVLARLLVEDQQADRKRVIERYAWEISSSGEIASEKRPAIIWSRRVS
jgi:hypothetical protein